MGVDVDRARRLLSRPWVVMPAAGLLVLGGWSLVRTLTSEDSSASAQGGEQLVEATIGNMAQTVTAEGQVSNAETDELSFTAAGTVSAVNVTAGQAVTAGQVLAVLDSPELAASVADAEAAVAEAQAALSGDQDAGSSTQIAADESAVTAAHDQLAAANEALAGAQLVASFDGVVTAVDVTVGEQLADGGTGGTSMTGSGSGSGQSGGTLGDAGAAPGSLPGQTGTEGNDDAESTSSPQVTVVSASRFTVELGVDDADIENLEVGQGATVTLSSSSTFPGGGGLPGGGAFPGGGGLPGGQSGDASDEGGAGAGETPSGPSVGDVAGVSGTVADVGQVADASSGVAEYPVTVTFQDTSGDYNAGATVSVEITYAEKTDVVQVPTLAVTTTDGESTVTVAVDGRRETRTVTTGLSSGGMVEITDGLEAGEQVVVTFPGGGQGGNGGGGGPGGGGAPPGGLPGAGDGSGAGE